MNDLEESLISHFTNCGCTQQNAAVTYQIYMELIDVRRFFNVKYHYDNNMKRMYLTATNSKSGPEIVFFPIATSENISFSMIEKIIELRENKSSYLAIISADSTSVFYQVSSGLDEVTSTEYKKLFQREKHDSEILQNRDDIEKLVSKNDK